MNLIIGNIISFIAAIFMALSCTVKSRNKIFYLQAANCFILSIASFFFGTFAGITTLFISGIRNIIVAKDKYSKKIMYIFLVLTVVMGFLANNRGFTGLLPVIATLQYTVCLNVFKGLLSTRISIFINTAIWVAYSFIIRDFSTACMDSISLITVTISTITLLFKKK